MSTSARSRNGSSHLYASRELFLHFLNRDVSNALHVRRCMSEDVRHGWYRKGVAVGVLLCNSYCLFPLSTLIEDDSLLQLLQEYESLFSLGTLRVSLREADFQEYLEKKRREYGRYPQLYAGYFGDSVEKRLLRLSPAIVSRDSGIGTSLSQYWKQELNDFVSGAAWDRVLKTSDQVTLKSALSELPDRIRDSGQGMIWPAISESLSELPPDLSKGVHWCLQHFYMRSYLSENSLAILTGLPFASTDLGLGRPFGLMYDYQAFVSVCRSAGIGDLIFELKPLELGALRDLPEFSVFKDAYFNIALAALSIGHIRKALELVRSSWRADGSHRVTKDRPFEEIRYRLDSALDRSVLLKAGVILQEEGERILRVPPTSQIQIVAKEVRVMNVFKNISGSTIVNESQVKNSFNKLKRRIDDDAATALLRLAEEVERSGDPDLGAIFESFNNELQKDKPNKGLMRTLWGGLTRQLPHIEKMVEIADGLSDLFT